MYLPDVHGDHLIRHTLVVPVLSIEYVVDEEQTEFFFTDFEVVQDDPVLVPFAQWSDFGYLWFLRSRRWLGLGPWFRHVICNTKFQIELIKVSKILPRT